MSGAIGILLIMLVSGSVTVYVLAPVFARARGQDDPPLIRKARTIGILLVCLFAAVGVAIGVAVAK